eukprot:TRINITY_DN19255_c0_g2_i1.p1 TRINITY_DN19255_c0_g2~~TRINITY_DN19255_c0_g2_i1.p1  ORF type:complete len:451 (+),score=180.84 TRINITY_DN19255_c0_g2_i1:966-2318(+)
MAPHDATEPAAVATAISDARAVEMFREFLRFRTVSQEGHRTGHNDACADWLVAVCEGLGLQTQRLESGVPHKPIVMAVWAGSEPGEKALLLNSHYDVVPVIDKHWTQPPWDAVRLEDPSFHKGPRIYGRGTQDMKCVCIQYLVAISRLMEAGYKPRRNVALSFVPDEEIGGAGMNHFTHSEAFKALNVECALDEGLSHPDEGAYTVFFGERTPWWVEVKAQGPTGHGSRFIEGMATNCINSWCSRALKFRKEQELLLHGKDEAAHGCGHAKCKKLGDVTTINLTVLRAGVTMDGGETYAVNVIPTEAMASFDVRIPLTMDHAELEALFTQWSREAEAEWNAAEGALEWSFCNYACAPLKKHHVSSTKEDNPYWVAFEKSVAAHGVDIELEVFPAGTDSRFLRALGINAFGFSPIKGDPILLHEHDEYISEKTFVEGCAVYVDVIRAMGSV